MMSPFSSGAREAGAAAGRALFMVMKREWAAATSGLDIVVEARAAMRGATARMASEAQAAALDGLSDEFDRLFYEWTYGGQPEAIELPATAEVAAE